MKRKIATLLALALSLFSSAANAEFKEEVGRCYNNTLMIVYDEDIDADYMEVATRDIKAVEKEYLRAIKIEVIKFETVDEAKEAYDKIIKIPHVDSIGFGGVSRIELPTEVLLARATMFKDVPSNFWAYKEIQWGKQNGFIKGYNDGTFKLNATLTEYQFASMLVSYCSQISSEMGGSGDYYNDLQPYNLPLKGYTDSKAKNSPVKREVVAQVLARLNGQSEDLNGAINWLSSIGITTAKAESGTSIVENFRPNENLTRAQAVSFFYRLAEIRYEQIKISNLNVPVD